MLPIVPICFIEQEVCLLFVHEGVEVSKSSGLVTSLGMQRLWFDPRYRHVNP